MKQEGMSPHPKRNARAPHKTHVLIIVENLSVPFDRRVWSEATTLARNGYAVSVICPKAENAPKSNEVIDGVEIFRHWLPKEGHGALGYVWEYSAALFWEFLLSFRIYIRHRFDILHACNPPDLLFLVGGVFKLLFGTKFVFDHHDIAPELYEAKYDKRGVLWRLLVCLERCTFALADISIATNESYYKIAIERGRMSRNRVFIVRSGPDLKRVHTVPSDERWKAGCRYLVAYVGVIGRQEGIDLLLDAVEYLKITRRRNDIRFIIIGNGPELPQLVTLAEDKGLTDLVKFMGRIDDASLMSILSSADVCVNPDRPNVMNDKSTMNKIMEYMALGKPIVQFDLTEGRFSAREASLYAKICDSADFAEKILTILEDPAMQRRMGEFGRNRVTHELCWDHEAPKLLRAYRSLVSDGGTH